MSDDRKYVCGRRLYAYINIRKFKGLDSREITSLPIWPEIKNVIYILHVISIIAEIKPHAHHKTIAYNESLQHPTIIFFADHATILSPTFHGLRKERLAQ